MEKDNNDGSKKNEPLDKKEEVQNSNDERIDQDFEGYPHNQSKEDIINPKNETERAIADVDNDNINDYADSSENKRTGATRGDINEIKSDASAGAFEATEEVGDELEAGKKKNKDQNQSEAY